MSLVVWPHWAQSISWLWTNSASYNFASSEYGGQIFKAIDLLAVVLVGRLVVKPWLERVHAHLECHVEGCRRWGHIVPGPNGPTAFRACRGHHPHQTTPITVERIAHAARHGHNTERKEPPMSKYIYGWRRPLPGCGALDLLPHVDTTGLTVKDEVDPRGAMPPVFDQGQLGSCTANATAAVFQYDGILDGHDPGELSRLWIYYFERSIEGTLDQGDCGAIGHDAFTVAKHGIPDEALWPYDIAKFEEKPPSAEPRAYTLEKPVRAVPQDEETMRQVLSNNQTMAFGFTVKASFEEEAWWASGKMPTPKASEKTLGGHEIDVVGFLKAFPEYALCRNSWNLVYGLFGDVANVKAAERAADKGGYFLFPWKLLLDPSVCSDFRTIVRAAA